MATYDPYAPKTTTAAPVVAPTASADGRTPYTGTIDPNAGLTQGNIIAPPDPKLQPPTPVYSGYMAPPAPKVGITGPGGLPIDPHFSEMGGNWSDPNSYASQANAALQLQAAGASQRAAPQLQSGAVNMFNTAAGNSMQSAQLSNLFQAQQANNAAAVGSGAAAQGQMNSANALMGALNGPGLTGQLATSGQLAGAANGPGVSGQLGVANALANAATNGPAYTNMMGAGQQLQGIATQGGINTGQNLLDAAYGGAYNGQMGLAGQLAGSAYGAGTANQNALAGQLAASANGPVTAGQLSLAQQLQAAGQLPTGPSVAELQLKQGADASMQQQMAMASAARGGNTALALQNAAQNQGATMGALNQQQALLRAQEDMANRQLHASTLQGAAGIEGNVYGQQATALQQAAGMYGNAYGQQQQALQGAAGITNNAGTLQGQLLSQATQQDLANRGLAASAVQGAGSLYGQAGNLQGTLAQAAGQNFQGAGQLQGSLLGAANQGYGQAAQTQASLLGAAGQQYGAAANTQLGAYGAAGQMFGQQAANQLGQANTNAGIAGTYAGLSQAQLQAQLGQNQLNDQTMLASQTQGNQLLASDRDALMNYLAQGQNVGMQKYAIDTGQSAAMALQKQQQQSNLMNQIIGGTLTAAGAIGGTIIGGPAGAVAGGAAGSALGGAVASSDIRAKTQIAPASGDVADAFRPLSASSYFYRDPNQPGAAQGQQFGPMAQQLEQTPAGATAVTQMPNGQKGIDAGRLALLNASATADMRRELDAMKGRRPPPVQAGNYGPY